MSRLIYAGAYTVSIFVVNISCYELQKFVIQ